MLVSQDIKEIEVILAFILLKMILLTCKITSLRFITSKHKDLRDMCLFLSFVHIYVPQGPLLV